MPKRDITRWDKPACDAAGPVLTELHWGQLGTLVRHAAQAAFVDHLYEEAHRFWLNGLEAIHDKEESGS